MIDPAVRDRLLALIADSLGGQDDQRLVLKGGTLLRLCAVNGNPHADAAAYQRLISQYAGLRAARRRGFSRGRGRGQQTTRH